MSGQLSSIQLVHPLYTSMIISSVSTFTLHSYIVPSFFIGFTSIQTFSYHIASQDFVLIWGFVDAVSLTEPFIMLTCLQDTHFLLYSLCATEQITDATFLQFCRQEINLSNCTNTLAGRRNVCIDILEKRNRIALFRIWKSLTLIYRILGKLCSFYK